MCRDVSILWRERISPFLVSTSRISSCVNTIKNEPGLEIGYQGTGPLRACVIIRGTHKLQHMSRIPILSILILSLVASIAWTIVCGQDMNFDLITYHYYLGYSAFISRFQLDFLAASVYGYQSPLPFVTLYWLDRIGMPSLFIAMLHAAFHALNLVLLYLLTELLVRRIGAAPERAKVIGFWLLGAIAPIYWTLVGTSFADLLTSVPVLAGLWLVARAISESGAPRIKTIAWIAVGGALVGAAAGARIHNSIYVAGLLCALPFTRFPDRKTGLQSIAAFSLAAFAAWLVCFAPWAYRLYAEFGSPLFPLFNGVFRAPDFPASNVPLISFTPGNLWEFITLPFWMGTDTHWVYVELPLPDVRPAVLVLSLIACSLVWLLNRGRWRAMAAAAAGTIDGNSETVRSQQVILIFFAVSAMLWFVTSMNGRFGVALFLLGGPVCGVLLSRLLPSRYVVLVIAGVVLWQAALQGVFFPEHRFNSMPWTARYFDWRLPGRLTREPATFVSFGFQPASTLVPRLPPGSSHVNLAGYPAVDAPGSDRVKRIIQVPNKRTYGVFDVTRHDPIDPAAIKTYYRSQLALWGLAFADDTCDLIALKIPSGNWVRFNAIARTKARYRPPVFMACALRPSAPIDHERALSEFKEFTQKLARVGASCPQYFGRPLGYVHTDKQWIVKSFASSDVSLEFDHEGRFYLRQLRPPHITLDLGRVTREAIVADEPDCRKWFSRLSELSAPFSRGVTSSSQ
jgi:hypothetical protein